MTFHCSKCDKWFQRSEFYSLTNGSRQSACKSCQKRAVSEWRAHNRERHNATAKRWRLNNPDKQKALNHSQYIKNKPFHHSYAKKWNAENREKRRAYEKKWRDKDTSKPIMLANARRWQSANKDKCREAERRYRATHLDKVRACQAASKQRARAKDPDGTHAYQRAHYSKHRERIRERLKKTYPLRAHKEREASRIYREQHPEQTKAAAREWRKKNPEKMKAKTKAWMKAHPAEVKAMRRRRRAVIAGAPINDFTAAQWLAIQAAADHRCAYCHKRFKGKLTQDHIVPLSKGGAHTASNIVPACGPCNSTKHTGPPLCPVQPLLLV